MNKPRNIYLLILPRVHLLDLAAPAQIFAHEAEDIAERCGFSAERSLRRTWGRWRSQTPSEYRQQLS